MKEGGGRGGGGRRGGGRGGGGGREGGCRYTDLVWRGGQRCRRNREGPWISNVSTALMGAHKAPSKRNAHLHVHVSTHPYLHV